MTDLRRYRQRLHAVLTPAERRVLARLDTPGKIQTWLDRLPPNYGLEGDTIYSPRRVLRERTAHCAEAAMLAACALAFHGKPALLMDFQTLPSDHDHVIALFRDKGLWGAISKTNHAILRWRDPVYRTTRELAMSYAHEYYLDGGKKTLLAFSRPFAVSRYAPEKWVTAEDDLDWLMIALDSSPHEKVAPASTLTKRRLASIPERKMLAILEYHDPREKGRVAKRALANERRKRQRRRARRPGAER